MNYINLTVQYYLYLLILSLVYKVIFILRVFGAYKNVKASNPVMLLGYISFLHSAGVGFLYYSLYYDAKFYIVFLVLNGMWMGAVAIGFLVAIIFKNLDEYDRDPLNHMVLAVTLTLAVALEVLVYLHRNTRIASRQPELVHKNVEKEKSTGSKKEKSKSKKVDVDVISDSSHSGTMSNANTQADAIIAIEPK